MTHAELETLTGMQFTTEEYATLDAFYLESGLEKEDFCTPQNLIKLLLVENEKERTAITNKAHYLICSSCEEDNREMALAAIDLIGWRKFLEYKVKNNLHLYRKDLEELRNLVGDERMLEILNE